MTKQQETLLHKYGHRALCVDSTHNTTRYALVLATVLVIDDYGRGRTVAYFLCKSESAEALEPLFDHIKNRWFFIFYKVIYASYCRCNFVEPKVLMSDDADSFWNAYSKYFNVNNTHRLLCSWHVLKNWAKNSSIIGDVEKRKRMKCNLFALIQ